MKDSCIQGCSAPGPRAQSKRKMLAFQLNTFFPSAFLFTRFFYPFSYQFSIIRESPFFIDTRALEQEFLMGDGWTDGSTEEEEGIEMWV